MKKTVKLDDILSIARGASPRPISNYITNESAGVNWIKIGDVDPNSFFITHTEEKITKEGAKKSRYVKEGDFILSNSMSFGRPYILKINGCVHDGWLILSDYENHVTSSYLYYLLRSPIVQNQFDGSANGATVRNLNSDIVRKVSVSIHTDKSEQQKIAALLDSIQSAIDNKKQQLQQLDELVKSKFVEMFGENPVESGKWKVEKLSSICKVQTGGTPSRMHPEYFEGNIPWITTANLGVNELNYDDAMEYITQEAVDNSATKIIPAHSLFIGIRVGVGKCSINNVDMCSNQDICGLSGFDVARTNLLFVKKVIDSYEDYFDNAKRGTTIKGVKSDTIKELKIFLPEIELQNTFAEYVQKIDSAKSIIKTQLVDLQELLDSKMDEYFGE